MSKYVTADVGIVFYLGPANNKFLNKRDLLQKHNEKTILFI